MRIVVALHKTSESGSSDKVYFASFVEDAAHANIASVTTAYGRRIAHAFTRSAPTTGPAPTTWAYFTSAIAQKRNRGYWLTAVIVDEHPLAPSNEALRRVVAGMRSMRDPIWLGFGYAEVRALHQRNALTVGVAAPNADTPSAATESNTAAAAAPIARARRSRTLQLAELAVDNSLDADRLRRECSVQVGVDGTRYLVVKTDGEIVVRSETGRALTRFPQIIREALSGISDIGLELVLDETGGLTALDLVRLDGRLYAGEPFRVRYAALAKQKTRRRIASIGIARACSGELTVSTLHTAAAKGASHLIVRDLAGTYGRASWIYRWSASIELDAEVRDIDTAARVVGVVANAGPRGPIALALAVPRDADLPELGARVRVTCSDLTTLAGARYAGSLAA
jgi:hypothetical protein